MPNFFLGKLSVWKESPLGWAVKAKVVHCHGMGEHSERHRNTFRAMLNRNIEVYRFDFRGCGKSRGERQWIDSFEEYVSDASDVLSEAQRQKPSVPVFLFGHSLGGAISLTLVAERSPSLQGLILNAPAFKVGKGVSPIKIMLGRLLNRFTPHLKIRETLDLTMLSRDRAIAPAYRTDPLCNPFNTVRQGNEILDALARLPGLAPQLELPLLITHGTADGLIPVQGSRELIALAGSHDKRLEEFPGGYHELHNDTALAEYLSFTIDWILERAKSVK